MLSTVLTGPVTTIVPTHLLPISYLEVSTASDVEYSPHRTSHQSSYHIYSLSLTLRSVQPLMLSTVLTGPVTTVVPTHLLLISYLEVSTASDVEYSPHRTSHHDSSHTFATYLLR
jgi:hypothetical protein